MSILDAPPCLADRAKAKVLAHYTQARAEQDSKYRDWAIYAYYQPGVIGYGSTEADAWLDAAARIT